MSLAARRADGAAVMAEAIELNTVLGHGHRKIAAVLGRPGSTVRDWLRGYRANIAAILTKFTALVHRGAADAPGLWPAPASTPGANALSMLMGYATTLAQYSSRRSSLVSVPWHYGALMGHGPWFFSATGWPAAVQHQPALPPGR
ncbi:hypothetical protein [Specibacter cremeus]|uniref:hypothetical protein n=1 Tax=Specibacter cremeus TaxID=1629051 RepID=UPI00197B9F60|nr:hypothetical protein [Specibacter cremeus]